MTATFFVGDAIEIMSKLPEDSVDLVLTSPPFLALRSYLPADHPDKALEGGSQATPGEFIDWLIDVVEACDRVLAPHGSLCIELGDTYAGSGGAGGDYDRREQDRWVGSAAWKSSEDGAQRHRKRNGPKFNQPKRRPGVSSDGEVVNVDAKKTHEGVIMRNGGGTGWPLAKSLSLIPELFRLTLVYGTNPLTGRQTDRWRLRNVVRWVRPNPPVGALGDKFRPATSELMVFCKSAKRYFDLDSVRTEPQVQMGRNVPGNNVKGSDDHSFRFAERVDSHPAGAPPLDWWNIPLLEGEEETRYGPGEKERAKAEAERNRPRIGVRNEVRHAVGLSSLSPGGVSNPLGSPPLDWWNIPPGGYEGAHYAVFPPELCIKPIKAMCPEKVCRQCGEPSRRIVGEAEYVGSKSGRPYEKHVWTIEPNGRSLKKPDEGAHRITNTLGWTDCGHDDWRPGLVLDPFGGSGTTALVATGHGRDCILIDLDERNFDLALQRVGPFILERAR